MKCTKRDHKTTEQFRKQMVIGFGIKEMSHNKETTNRVDGKIVSRKNIDYDRHNEAIFGIHICKYMIENKRSAQTFLVEQSN